MSPICFRAVFDESDGLWLTGPASQYSHRRKLASSAGSRWSGKALVAVTHQRLSLAKKVVIQDSTRQVAVECCGE
jgi:hypothetical protein